MIQIHHGNCLDVLRGMPSESIDSIVTDPPYGLSFMGKKWDYDVPAEEIWRECLRVLKPGGHLLAFAGTRTQHRMAVRIEDAGFEIRDMIAWVYGSGFPKSKNLDGDWKGWGTALKPALEPITVARKPLGGTVAENVLAHGTGALNIDGCRVDASDGRPLIESKSEASLHAFGNGLNGSRCAGITTQGRWPANLIHDGSDEVVGMFPDTGASPKQYTKKKAGWLTPGSTHEENALQSREYGDSGSAARFFQQCKSDYNEEWQDQNQPQSSADTAPSSSSLQNLLADSVQKAAAIWPSLAGILSSEQTGLSTSVTPNESSATSETAMQAMASIGSGCSQESQHERRTRCGSLVKTAAARSPTGIMTITTSLCRSDGSAEAATFTIMPTSLDRGDQVSRFNYCAKASKADRDEGCEGLAQRTAAETVERAEGSAGLKSPRAGAGRTSGARNHHPTVKPTDLMRYLCRLVTPPGGVVLDPFLGSGSTGKAALLEGFRFVGIEREAEYVEIARARIAAVQPRLL